MEENKHEELISAYLDGELNAAEQERTVKWIAEDPRAQKLLEELQGLQEAMRELPRHRLENNLTQPVLEQIDAQPAEALYSMASADMQPEKIMCEMAPTMDALAAPAAISHASSEPEKSLDHDRRRLYLWPAVAIAAAVLLMVFSSREPVEKARSVARSDLEVGQESAVPQEATARPLSTVAIESLPQQFKLRSAEPRAQRSLAQARTGDPEGSSFAQKVAPAAEGGEELEFNQPSAFADQDSQASAPDTEHLLTTYFFNASAEIDIKSQLENLSKESDEVKVVDLGSTTQDASFAEKVTDYRVFDLYGDPEATHKVIEALKNVQGLTFSTRKRIHSEEFQNRSEKNKRPTTKFQRLEKKEAFPSPAPDCIRLIFLVPPSRSQPSKR